MDMYADLVHKRDPCQMTALTSVGWDYTSFYVLLLLVCPVSMIYRQHIYVHSHQERKAFFVA